MVPKSLNQSVGMGQPNADPDVRMVQTLLNRHSHLIGRTLRVDGHAGPATIAAIVAFQRKGVGMLHPDGIIGVLGVTFRKLSETTVADHLEPSASAPSKGSVVSVLSDSDYAAAAQALSTPRIACEVNAIKAVAKTETGICGVFDRQNRPVILYERHHFSRLTDHVYDKDPHFSDISSPVPYSNVPGGYGKCSVQYTKLERAEKLSKTAALESCSWGKFQLLGENYKECGFDSVDAMVAKMYVSVQEHLNAFVSFIKSKPGAWDGLLKKKWAEFAANYNGPGYKKFNYDTVMAANYAELGGK